jgi:hypothetical protein
MLPIYPKIACIGPTAHQLQDILWTEMSKWFRQSLIRDEFVIQKDKIFGKAEQKEWWIRAISISAKSSEDEQAEKLAGLHGDHLLLIVDEASGVPDPVFVTLEGAMTQEDNIMVLIGNMTRNSGYFYDSHFHPTISKDWTKLHWDSRKSSNVKQSYCDYMATKYGVESNVFRIRVAGDPPLEDDNVLIPLAWSMACVGNEHFEMHAIPEDEPLYLGVDVARYGVDDSVVLPRIANCIKPWDTYHSLNTITLAGHVLQTFTESEAQGCGIDVIGVGAGVYDWLEKHNVPNLYGVNVANASSDSAKYHRLRDELWVNMREKCLEARYYFPDITLPGDNESLGARLANELSSVRYSFDANGAFLVESKKDMRNRGVESPNIADALGISEYFYNVATQVFSAPQKRQKPTWDRARYPENSWYGHTKSSSWQGV